MHTDTTLQPEVFKELTIANLNNRLATDCFIVIDLAPPAHRRPLRSEMETRLYSAKHNDDQFFVKIIDMLFVPFKKLTDHMTLWSDGLTYIDFKKEFFENHPKATEETEVVICYYKRCKEDELRRVSNTRNGNTIKIFC